MVQGFFLLMLEIWFSLFESEKHRILAWDLYLKNLRRNV